MRTAFALGLAVTLASAPCLAQSRIGAPLARPITADDTSSEIVISSDASFETRYAEDDDAASFIGYQGLSLTWRDRLTVAVSSTGGVAGVGAGETGEASLRIDVAEVLTDPEEDDVQLEHTTYVEYGSSDIGARSQEDWTAVGVDLLMTLPEIEASAGAIDGELRFGCAVTPGLYGASTGWYVDGAVVLGWTLPQARLAFGVGVELDASEQADAPITQLGASGTAYFLPDERISPYAGATLGGYVANGSGYTISFELGFGFSIVTTPEEEEEDE